MHAEKVPLQRIELIVVGNGGSGKTTLIKRLRSNEFDPSKSTMTDGIEMTRFYIGPVRFSVKDFAGQDDYSHTHTLFLTENAIYLAVFNPRNENNTDALSAFLFMIRDHAPNAKVLLVTTRAAEAKMDKMDLKKLRQIHPCICEDVLEVDSFTGSGLEPLKDKLLSAALEKEHTKQVVSTAVSHIADSIDSLREEDDAKGFRVPYDEFGSRLENEGYPVNEIENAVKLLKQWGSIYVLSNKDIVLRPQALAKVFACVISKKPETLNRIGDAARGVLHHTEEALRAVWGDYDEALWLCPDSNSSSPFLDLLHDTGLAYSVYNDEGHRMPQSIVPAMLGDKPEGFAGDMNSELELMAHFFPDLVQNNMETKLEKFKIVFSFLPIHFFARLLSRLEMLSMNDGSNGSKTRFVWRKGAILSAGVSFALLTEKNKSLEISFTGVNRSIRSVVLVEITRLMEEKFSTMKFVDFVLIVGGRKWHMDDIEEALQFSKGKLVSQTRKVTTRVFSLFMLFLKKPPSEKIERLQELLAFIEKNPERSVTDFLVMINYELQSCLLILLDWMGLEKRTDGLSRPLWVVLKRTDSVTGLVEYAATPYSPHYVPDEPWIPSAQAQVVFVPSQRTLSSVEKQRMKLASTLVKASFLFMRAKIEDMLPKGWEWAEAQWLEGIDTNTVIQMEASHFSPVGPRVYSKHFQSKAAARKSVIPNMVSLLYLENPFGFEHIHYSIHIILCR